MNLFSHEHVKVIRCHFTSEEMAEINNYLKIHSLDLSEALKDALLKTIQDDFDEQMITSYYKMREDSL